MNIADIIDTNKDFPAVNRKDRQIGLTVLQKSFAVEPDELVIIITDDGKLQEAAIFFAAAVQLNAEVQVVVLEGMTQNAQEPPAKVTDLLCKADIGLLITSYSLSHTRARAEANEAGTRIASMPGITTTMFPALEVDYQQLAADSSAIAAAMTNGDALTVTSPGGTKLTAALNGRTAIGDDGQLKNPGDFGNLPAGEGFIAPLETEVNGQLVIDGSLADIKLDSPITLTVIDGVATKITGRQAAAELKAAMEDVGPEAKVVCEIGIGTNPQARVEAHILESEKAYGTCHLAFGDNHSFGGANEVAFHSDGLILDPTVTIDDMVIVEAGEIL